MAHGADLNLHLGVQICASFFALAPCEINIGSDRGEIGLKKVRNEGYSHQNNVPLGC